MRDQEEKGERERERENNSSNVSKLVLFPLDQKLSVSLIQQQSGNQIF